ncbi:hypothetical protein [Sphingomonas montanisoli]|uniref:Helix-turn-helix transcriptional regulator n=1 Tax=Sphingomonas montanisoli TaxID=2606412 RepID=A0A5D9C6N9_9SPHN|nr:hypothetical protein [Sphingomonas montanisoli]TZG27126.1 hypothetical protein FYJ91_05710 [Sphingomonas montanisoli]
MTAMPSPDTIRERIKFLAAQRGTTLLDLSKRIGRNEAYLQQFIERGSPRRLREDDRLHLAMALDVDERLLGARDPWSPIDASAEVQLALI